MRQRHSFSEKEMQSREVVRGETGFRRTSATHIFVDNMLHLLRTPQALRRGQIVLIIGRRMCAQLSTLVIIEYSGRIDTRETKPKIIAAVLETRQTRIHHLEGKYPNCTMRTKYNPMISTNLFAMTFLLPSTLLFVVDSETKSPAFGLRLRVDH